MTVKREDQWTMRVFFQCFPYSSLLQYILLLFAQLQAEPSSDAAYPQHSTQQQQQEANEQHELRCRTYEKHYSPRRKQMIAVTVPVSVINFVSAHDTSSCISSRALILVCVLFVTDIFLTLSSASTCSTLTLFSSALSRFALCSCR